MPKIAKKGHNRIGGIDAEQLESLIQRIEKLEEEKSAVAESIRDVYAEAKGNGFDVKTVRAIAEALFDTYRMALGMIPTVDEVV